MATSCEPEALIIDKKDFEHALADLDQAVQLDPKDALAYVSRGVASSAKEAYDKAVADFDQAIQLDPKDASGLHQSGRGMDGERGVRQGDRRLRPRRSDSIPKDATAYSCRGWRLGREARVRQGDRRLRPRRSGSIPRDAYTYGGRAMAWGAKEEYDKAIADFDEAIRLDPKTRQAY